MQMLALDECTVYDFVTFIVYVHVIFVASFGNPGFYHHRAAKCAT